MLTPPLNPPPGQGFNRMSVPVTGDEQQRAHDAKGHTIGHALPPGPAQQSLCIDHLTLLLQQRVVDHVVRGERAQAVTIVNGEINGHADNVTASLNQLLTINNEEANRAAERASLQYDTALSWVVVTLVLAAGITITLAWVFTRSVVGPLGMAVSVAERIAGGDALDEVVVTNTIPLSAAAAQCTKIRQLSVAPLIADTIQRIAKGDSVMSLFTE